MNTKPKRKYGPVRKGAETTAGTNESVFDKFLPPADAKPAPAAPDTLPTTPPSTPPSTRTSTPARTPSPRDVSPKRDFQKVANSITREAVPAGMFNGKAKQLYDSLYALTRGAIVPSMTARISRADLMKKSGIGAKVTLEQNLRRLALSGLVSIKTIGGIQGGNEYTVYLPEEVTPPSTPPSMGTSPPSPPSGGQNLGLLASLETSPPSTGLSAATAESWGEPKTSFKTKDQNTDDDAALAELFRRIERELIGKPSAPLDSWKELADVLATELKIAAARTGSVSNVPAFLTEHLRRRLFKRSKEEMQGKGGEAAGQTARAQANASACPDCGGTGWWYPDGSEKGVAKCGHTKLESVPPEK